MVCLHPVELLFRPRVVTKTARLLSIGKGAKSKDCFSGPVLTVCIGLVDFHYGQLGQVWKRLGTMVAQLLGSSMNSTSTYTRLVLQKHLSP